MLIRDCMTRQTTGVTFQTPARHVAKLMNHYDVETIPVVDDDRQLVGCVMASDLWSLLCALRGAPEDTGIRGIAGAVPPTVSADDTIEAGARVLFRNPLLEALPVIENGCVVGILSRHSLLRVLARLPTGRRRSKTQVIDQIEEHEPRNAALAGVATLVALSWGRGDDVCDPCIFIG